MKPLDKFIVVSTIILLIFSSCKEPVKSKEKIIETPSLLKNIDSIENCLKVMELSRFYDQIKHECQTSNKEVAHLFSKEVKEHYKQDFCNLFNDAVKNIDGQIEYDIDENCNGIINIISVEIIDEDGEKFRNEYATFLYIKKEKGRLKIYDIGGAG